MFKKMKQQVSDAFFEIILITVLFMILQDQQLCLLTTLSLSSFLYIHSSFFKPALQVKTMVLVMVVRLLLPCTFLSQVVFILT